MVWLATEMKMERTYLQVSSIALSRFSDVSSRQFFSQFTINISFKQDFEREMIEDQRRRLDDDVRTRGAWNEVEVGKYLVHCTSQSLNTT